MSCPSTSTEGSEWIFVLAVEIERSATVAVAPVSVLNMSRSMAATLEDAFWSLGSNDRCPHYVSSDTAATKSMAKVTESLSHCTALRVKFS